MKALAFIDSGIGGLPYLVPLRAQVPGLDLVYVADTLNFPYGPKSEAEISRAVLSMTRRLVDRYDPEAVVVACNTASVVALDQLRQTFDLPFVGVVPAVKPAAALSKSGVIAVMATERTVKGRYLDGLINTYASHLKVLRYPATRLIRKIEEDPFMIDRPGYESLLGELKEEFLRDGVDTVVLGCTHFLHLDHFFEDYFGHAFTVLDSREGVCRQTLKVLQGRTGGADAFSGLDQGGTKQGRGVLHLTGKDDPDDLYRRVAERFGLEFGGEL